MQLFRHKFFRNTFAIISIAVIFNLLMAEVVLAQATGTTGSNGDTPIKASDLTGAQASQAACSTFSTKVSTATNKQFQAQWTNIPFTNVPGAISNGTGNGLVEGGVSALAVGNQQCFILTGNATSNTFYEVITRPQAAIDLENRIRSSPNGISSNDLQNASAQLQLDNQESSPLSKVFGLVLSNLGGVVALFISGFTSLAAQFYDSSVRFSLSTNFDEKFVDVGWGIVRDICNLFFILILIVIGFATILGIDEYNYSHLLGRLVLMAILVNFSEAIALAIINAFNILTNVFYSDSSLTTLLGMIQKIVLSNLSTTGSWEQSLMYTMTTIVFAFLALWAFLKLAYLFLVRTAGLYVLVILSPFAFVFNIMHATHEYAHEWQKYFIKYLVWAPVSVFFVRLADLIAQTLNTITTNSANPIATLSQALAIKNPLFEVLVILAFLLIGVEVAEEAGMQGAQIGLSLIEKGEHAVSHAAQHAASNFVGRRWNDATSHMLDKNPNSTARKVAFAVLNPVQFGKAWSERSHEKAHISSSYAQAAAREMLGGPAGTPYRENVVREEEMKYAKEYLNMTKEQKAIAARKLMGLHDHESQVRRRALMRAAAEDHHIEDIMASGAFVEKYTDDKGDISREATYRFLTDFLDANHDKQSQRFIASDLNNIGAKVKRFDYTGMATIDPETGKYKANFTAGDRVKIVDGQTIHLMDDAGQAAYAGNEMSKLEAQDRAKLSPQNFTTIRTTVTTDDRGKKTIGQQFVYKNDAYGQATIKNLDEGVRANINRTQARFVEALMPGTANDDGSITVHSKEDAEAISGFFAANPEHAKAINAKKMGYQDADKQVPNVKKIEIRVEGSAEPIILGDKSASLLIKSSAKKEAPPSKSKKRAEEDDSVDPSME